jgi:hypothetical protein
MGRDQFLQGPSPRKPSTLLELLSLRCSIDIIWDIGQKSIANSAILIPPVHRVDSLRKFRTAPLVDTAGIDPGIFKTITGCLAATSLDLLVT